MSEEPPTPDDPEESLIGASLDVPSPAWHADVLAQREEDVRLGKARVLDWDECKKALQWLFP